MGRQNHCRGLLNSWSRPLQNSLRSVIPTMSGELLNYVLIKLGSMLATFERRTTVQMFGQVDFHQVGASFHLQNYMVEQGDLAARARPFKRVQQDRILTRDTGRSNHRAS